MSEEQVRERARERLLSAELAVVLSTELVTIDAVERAHPRRRATWLAAAAIVLGLSVAVGVWRLDDARQPLQQRGFDPVDPWYEHEWPFRTPLDVVRTRADVAQLPAERSRFTVVIGEGEGDRALAALLQRERIDELFLIAGGNGEWQPPWRAIAARDELRSLMIGGRAVLRSRPMRELRRLPDLAVMSLLDLASPFDEELAGVVAELPKLRQLHCSRVDVSAAGLDVLQVMPHLDTVLLHFDQRHAVEPDELLASVARLRNLRAFSLQANVPLDAQSLRRLHALRNLIVLRLGQVGLDDEALAALPDGLEALALPTLDDVTADGVAKLKRLRRLRALAHGRLASEQVREAMAGLLTSIPLEHYEARAAALDERLWRALQAQPKLRRLTLMTTSNVLPGVLAAATGCRALEVLVVEVEALPEPRQLAGLRDHPSLRRIRFVRYRPGTPVPTADQIVALQQAAGVAVEVR